MSLLDLLVPKTKVPEPVTEIEGKILRFGLWKADEYTNDFAFRLDGYDELFTFRLSASHGIRRIGLVAAGDAIKASGVMRDGLIDDCTITVHAGTDRFSFQTRLTIHG